MSNPCNPRPGPRRLSPAALHRDERGTISIVALFSLLLLVMLLGQVINAGRQVDSKVKMQNAADAATYSGGVVLARGMNTLAFTNHLLCDVFALTAFMREGSARRAEQYVPQILAAWTQIGPVLAGSGFPKFDALGPAIMGKTPLEQDMVSKYNEWLSATAETVLPVLEEILAQEMIPQFQRTVVLTTPELAQAAAGEVARRHGLAVSTHDQARGQMSAVLWRTMGDPVGGGLETMLPTLPAVDPVYDSLPNQAQYFQTAVTQRRSLATNYLSRWNSQYMQPFDAEAKMSQFGRLWRGFTCAELKRLLEEEYPDRNLPYVIRSTADDLLEGNPHLEQDYTWVGVAYWQELPPTMPGLFAPVLNGGAQTYAQGRLFIPTRRLVRGYDGPAEAVWHWLPYDVYRQNRPTTWNLLNQNWTFQLTPATTAELAGILSQPPPAGLAGGQLQVPDFSVLSGPPIRQLTTH